MALQTDYRPTKFSQVAGNKSTVKAVQMALQRKDHNHCMLFSGQSGCGKTTLAYLVAQELGVLDLSSNSNPCFREFNASDFRGIDTVRQVRSESAKAPITSDIRVFFFDECHKLTSDAQEAFLKILEQADSVNYYLFATTNPESLRVTFKRRCAIFDLAPLAEAEIVELLTEVAQSEKISIPNEVFEHIAQNATGSPGIALGMLDAIIGLPTKDMLEVSKRTVEVQNDVIQLCRALAKRGTNWKEVSGILNGLRSEDPESIRRAVMGYCSNWLLKQDNPRAFLILDAFAEPIFSMGFPGIVRACYMALNG